MMTVPIYVHAPNGTQYSVGDRLKQSAMDANTITREVERGLFEITVSDAHAVFRDPDRYVLNIFTSADGNAIFRTVIHSDEPFWGYVDLDSVKYDVKEKETSFDIFSMLKRFWDIAKTTHVLTTGDPYEQSLTYISVPEVLIHEIIRPGLNTSPFLGVVANIVATDFASQYIRGWWDGEVDSDVGYEGMYSKLDPATTVEELLKAMALYYSAEFDLDAPTGTLYMRTREKIINDTATRIDDIIIQTEPIEVHVCDDKKYDYLYTYFRIPAPPAPELISYGNGGEYAIAYNRTWRYVMVAIIDEKPTEPSVSLDVELPPNEFYQYQITLRIPASFTGTTRREIWRTGYHNPWSYYLAGVIDGNTTTTWTDVGDQRSRDIIVEPDPYADEYKLKPLPMRTTNAWLQYLDSTGWASPILDIKGQGQRPEGRILDTRPQLTFVSNNIDNTTTSDPYWTFKFFGRNRTFAEIQSNDSWLDVFRVRRRLECTVDGLVLDLGQTITADSIVPNDFTPTTKLLVRHIAQNLYRGNTTIKALTI